VTDETDDGLTLEKRLRDALAPRYVLLRPIGKGGMGAVFLAREPELARLVAVKVLSPELADETARARFLREAQSAASIGHPNVVAVHSIGALEDGTPYFVMQYATGESISSRLAREGPVGSVEARRMIGELASALAAAHAHGVVHRDVKPANVLYDQESGRVLLTDFGIAAVRAPAGGVASPQLTGTGMLLGTPQYMSPEQLTGEVPTDKTDVYGLGLVAYELLCGAAPFEATSPMHLMAAHLREVPKPLSELRPDVDPELEQLVGACLEKDPAARPSAADIQRRLGAAEVILEWPPPGLAPLQGMLRSVARLLLIGGGIVAAAVVTFFEVGSRVSARGIPFSIVLMMIAMATGGVLLGAGFWKLWVLTRTVSRAASLGYGRNTIAEVASDARRDTGVLIAGLKEYASLTADERSELRRQRVIASGLMFAAGVLVVPLLVLFFWLAGSVPARGVSLGVISFAPVFGLLTFAGLLYRREWARLRQYRRRIVKRREKDDATATLVASWGQTFDAARTGQGFTAGVVSRATAHRIAATLITLATTITLACLLPIFVVGILGPILWPNILSNGFASVESKSVAARVSRPLVLPVDSTITPLEAGDALYALSVKPGDETLVHSSYPLRPVKALNLLPPPYRPPLFSRTVVGMKGKPFNFARDGSQVPGAPGNRILEYAARGLTPAEQQWLAELDASPKWELWRRFARARRADVLGGQFVLPFSDDASELDMPIMRYSGIKTMAYASVRRAALYRSRGQIAKGDTILRETISAGFRLAEDDPMLIGQLIGIVVVGIGHNALHEARQLDGRPEGEEWTARMTIVAANEFMTPTMSAPAAANVDARVIRKRIIEGATSKSHLRGIRVANYRALVLAPCTNVHELISGPDEDVRVALEDARRQLVGLPSDSVFLDMLDRQAKVDWREADAALSKRLMMPLARLSGTVLRNPRIPGCVSLLLSNWYR
jgi:hypothetical protein